jgi:hypothetical protein
MVVLDRSEASCEEALAALFEAIDVMDNGLAEECESAPAKEVSG